MKVLIGFTRATRTLILVSYSCSSVQPSEVGI